MTSKTVAPSEPRTDIPARRISAFIYGNILVLAALVVLSPDDLKTTKGVVYVMGVVFSTFVAHVASDVFAHLLRHPDGKGLSRKLPCDLRDAVPISYVRYPPNRSPCGRVARIARSGARLGHRDRRYVGAAIAAWSHFGLDRAGAVFAVAAGRGRPARLVDRHHSPVEGGAHSLIHGSPLAGASALRFRLACGTLRPTYPGDRCGFAHAP